jgi:hypothetical protein
VLVVVRASQRSCYNQLEDIYEAGGYRTLLDTLCLATSSSLHTRRWHCQSDTGCSDPLHHTITVRSIILIVELMFHKPLIF